MSDQSLIIRPPSFRGFVEFAKKNQDLIDQQDSVVEFIVHLSERAMLFGDNHVYYDPYLVAQLVSGARGACFLHPGDVNEIDFDSCIGKPVLEVVENTPLPIGIALLDAYYSLINPKLGIIPKNIYTFNGLGAEKSLKRAKKIVELAEVTKRSKVLLIGVISDIVRELLGVNVQIKLSDFLLAGTKIHGIDVTYDATPLLEWADIIIMTGNVLKTETLESLMEQINKRKKRLLVYALTGGHIAPYYLKHGASVVTVEKFPFYWYANLESTMEAYKEEV